jgi:hypothetical protein
VVTQVNGLAHGFEADALLRQTGNRQQSGHRAQRDDQHVVLQGFGSGLGIFDGDGFVVVLDVGHARGDHVAPLQYPAQGRYHMARLDGARRRFR